MKALQVALFLLGGGFAIYAGIDNGYTVALTGIIAAFFGSVVIPETVAKLRPQKRRNGGTE